MDDQLGERPEQRVSEDFFQGTVEHGLERMRLRLLDLTNRNRLLNFRHTRRSTLDLLGHAPETLYDQLRDGAEISFRPVPKPPRDGRQATARAYAEHLGLPTAVDLPSYVRSTEASRPVREIQTLHFPEDLEAILRHISGAARLSIEETGVNMLYLIFGFLEWHDSDDSERPVLAPLVLLPATIERGQPDPATRTYQYVLKASGEDVAGNISLQERLRRDFSLALPDFSEETELGAYFTELRPLLRGQPRWSIRRRVTLGLVSFQKLLMYRDLDPRAWPGGTGPLHHSRVRELFEGVASDGFAVAPDYHLDDPELRGKVPPLIYDADSSQHSALVDALAGKNLVIQGPPGTGKSQTITNLIAAAVASGKTVLFVAEKLAALEVVKRRLDAAGLGAFCLELHSHKTKKKEILADIEARSEQRFSDAAGLVYQLEQLERQRTALNEYAETINQPLSKSGYTIYEVLWGCSRRRTCFASDAAGLEDVRVAAAATLTPADIGNIRHALATFSALFVSMRTEWGGSSRHPWAGVCARITTFENERAVLAATQRLVGAADALSADSRGMPTDLEAATSSALLAEANAVDGLRSPDTPFFPVLLAPLTAQRPIVTRFLEMLESYRDAFTDVSVVVPGCANINGPAIEAMATAVEGLVRSAVPRATLAELHTEVARLRGCLAAVDEARAAVEAIRRELSCDLPFSLDALHAIEAAAELLRQAPVAALHMRHPGLAEAGAASVAAAAQADAARLNDQRSRLGAVVNLSLAPSREDVRRYVHVVAAGGIFAMLQHDYRAARRAFLGMRKTEARASRTILRQVFTDLLDHADGTVAFQSNGGYRQVARQHFKATNTDFGQLWTVAAWKEQVDARLSSFGAVGGQIAAAMWDAPAEQLKRAAALESPPVAERVGNGVRAGSAFSAIAELNAAVSLDDIYQTTNAMVERYARDLDELGTQGISGDVAVADLPRVVSQLRELVRLRESIATATAIQELVGAAFAGTDTSIDAIKETLAIYDGVNRSQASASVKTWLLDPAYADRFHQLTRWASEVRTHIEEFDRAVETFEGLTMVDASAWFRDGTQAFRSATVDRIAARGREALTQPQHLQTWSQCIAMKQELAERGLTRLVDTLEKGAVAADQLSAAFDLVYFQSLAETALTENPVLARFNGLTHEQVRRRFAELDAEVMELYRARVAHQASQRTIPPGMSTGPVSSYTEAALLRHEIKKQRRHIPLRQLVARSARALQALKPCFMMSPLSVAQYLAPASIAFDIVVMDEASQLKPEDALGAVLRGTQLVVVGDQMQLPPTSFFERLDGDDEDEADESAAALADSESILDVAGMLYVPARLLKWHYRSQHGSLIAFSNAEFYGNRLVVFPSPIAQSPDLGIQFVHVRNAVYQTGTNVEEARRVIDEVLRHMRYRPGESLGVVALNLRQREVLEDEFDRRLKDDVFAQSFIEGHRQSAEPFFIKNLENVQGDERDAIFISVTYGPDRAGNVFQRFGPITGRHGHRRLNVLFTRAKRRVVVVSSITSEQVVAGSSWGVRALKGYLAYAQTGTLAETRFTGREPDSDFEVEVAEAIRALGFDVVAQLGVAGFFLDLAVKHPALPDAFILGIECDGATYHSARAARDRDRLRQEILENLNWRVHRIWSTDWYRNHAAVIAKLKNRLDEVLREHEEQRRRVPVAQSSAEPPAVRAGGAGTVAVAPPASAEAPPITAGEAERLLVDLRERVLTRKFPNSDRSKGLLRRSMINQLLARCPTNLKEWATRIPEYDRKNTDERQLMYLEDIFKILARIAK